MSEQKLPIPIKNIFYMLCYAWNILTIKGEIDVDEDDFGDAYNLLARIFTFGLGKLIRSGFHRSYIEETELLSSVRGKINISGSIRARLKRQQKLECTYDDYSKNDCFNQILKYTIDVLVKHPEIDKKIKKDLKRMQVYFAGIDATAPTKEVRRKLVFNRNNTTYKMLIHVAIMLYDNTMVNEESGKNAFADFFRDGQMERVYEMFILNFYALHLNSAQYRVHAPKITWNMEEDAEERYGGLVDLVMNPSDRRTDIVIENKVSKKQLILDAKYYQETLVRGYRDTAIARFRRNHIDQVRGYVLDSKYSGKKLGALVYPTVKDDFPRPQMAPMQGSLVLFKTLNLNKDWREIEQDLLAFVPLLEQVLDQQQT